MDRGKSGELFNEGRRKRGGRHTASNIRGRGCQGVTVLVVMLSYCRECGYLGEYCETRSCTYIVVILT